MIHSIYVVVGLAVVWMALWESATVGTAIAGLAVGAAVIRLVPPRHQDTKIRVRAVPFVRLVIYFSRKLVMATALVAWEVVTPRNAINQGIVAVPMRGVSEGVVTIVANMVSLTPGTLTIEVLRNPMTLYVHVLHLRSVDEVRGEIGDLEELAIAAFAPRATVNDGGLG